MITSSITVTPQQRLLLISLLNQHIELFKKLVKDGVTNEWSEDQRSFAIEDHLEAKHIQAVLIASELNDLALMSTDDENV